MMDITIKTNLQELEEKLSRISKDFTDPVENSNQSIKEISFHLKKLKDYVLENSFDCQEDEIHFFKKVKPLFASKMIFYKKMKKLEISKPIGSRQMITEYYQDELQKLNFAYNENLVFYDYYRLDNTYLDDKLFVRNPVEVCPNIDPIYYEMDHRFSTTHDFLVANILANELIQHYIEYKINTLHEIKPAPIVHTAKKTKLKWTLPKTNMVEMVYAYHAVGAFNNGNVEIKDIAEYLEEVHDVNLGDYYGTFSEIKGRKMSLTIFIDFMKEELEKKIRLQDALKKKNSRGTTRVI